MYEESDFETSRTGDYYSGSRKSKEWWVETKEKVSTVDEEILIVMKHLDDLRSQLDLGKARDQAAMDWKVHWLTVELETSNRHAFPISSSYKKKLNSEV